jgi:hypothetical protein
MDDEWRRAAIAFIGAPRCGKPDPKPLAALLLSEKPIPPAIRAMLASLIDPGVLPVRTNYRVALKRTGAFDRWKEKMLFRQRIALEVAEKVRAGETVEEACLSIGDRFYLKRKKRRKLELETKKKYYDAANKGAKFWGLPLGAKKSG